MGKYCFASYDIKRKAQCELCGKPFKKRSYHHRFCSKECEKASQQALAASEAKIELPPIPMFRFGNELKCSYCGEPAECIDHVIPYSFLTAEKRTGLSPKGPMTYACSECNQILSDKLFWTFRERINEVQKAYAAKSRKFSRTPKWSEEEMREVDFSLQQYIRKQQFRMSELDRKRQWTESRGYNLLKKDIEKLPYLDKQDSKFNEFLAGFFINL